MYNEETYRPIDNMVFVKMDPYTDIKGGIILPQEALEKFERMATVIATGRGYNTITGIVPCNVTPGDRILVNLKSISPLEHLDDTRFGVMRDAHIMGIISAPLPVPKPKAKPKKKKFISIEKIENKKEKVEEFAPKAETIDLKLKEAPKVNLTGNPILDKKIIAAVNAAKLDKKGK